MILKLCVDSNQKGGARLVDMTPELGGINQPRRGTERVRVSES